MRPAELNCGDLILNFDKNGSGCLNPLNPFCCNEAMALKTCRDLYRLIRPERIYPGHGKIISRSGNTLPNVRTFHETND